MNEEKLNSILCPVNFFLAGSTQIQISANDSGNQSVRSGDKTGRERFKFGAFYAYKIL